MQHGADLLTQFQGGSSDQTWRLPPDPDEHVRPAVEDVHALCVQQSLHLRKETEADGDLIRNDRNDDDGVDVILFE